MPGVAVVWLLACWLAAGGPQDAREEDRHENGDNDERGSNIHNQAPYC